MKSFPRRFGNQQARVCSAAFIMSGRKPRSVANPLESAITTPSEKILKECHTLYVDTENGKMIGNVGQGQSLQFSLGFFKETVKRYFQCTLAFI